MPKYTRSAPRLPTIARSRSPTTPRPPCQDTPEPSFQRQSRMTRKYSPTTRLDFTQRPSQEGRTRLRRRPTRAESRVRVTGPPANEYTRSDRSLMESLTGFAIRSMLLPAISRSFSQEATAIRQLPKSADPRRGREKETHRGLEELDIGLEVRCLASVFLLFPAPPLFAPRAS